MASETSRFSTISRVTSNSLTFFWLGRLVEFDRTDRLFTAPAEKLTEDYVTGRFG